MIRINGKLHRRFRGTIKNMKLNSLYVLEKGFACLDAKRVCIRTGDEEPSLSFLLKRLKDEHTKKPDPRAIGVCKRNSITAFIVDTGSRPVLKVALVVLKRRSRPQTKPPEKEKLS